MLYWAITGIFFIQLWSFVSLGPEKNDRPLKKSSSSSGSRGSGIERMLQIIIFWRTLISDSHRATTCELRHEFKLTFFRRFSLLFFSSALHFFKIWFYDYQKVVLISKTKQTNKKDMEICATSRTESWASSVKTANMYNIPIISLY